MPTNKKARNRKAELSASSYVGLGGESSGCTLEEIGKELGLTRERVRQIEAKALVKFRALMLEKFPDIHLFLEDNDFDNTLDLVRAFGLVEEDFGSVSVDGRDYSYDCSYKQNQALSDEDTKKIFETEGVYLFTSISSRVKELLIRSARRKGEKFSTSKG